MALKNWVEDVLSYLGEYGSSFISDTASGPEYEIQIWRCALIPDGDLSMITEDWGELAFKIEVEKRETDHPTEPYMRIVQLTTGAAATTTTTS